jgi:hypothetical protein
VHLVAVDPGEKYCGVAWFVGDPAWRCTSVETFDPAGCVDLLWAQMRGVHLSLHIDLLVIEEYRIYPGHDDYSDVGTVKVIGALEHMARQCGIKVVLQPARIQKIMRPRLKVRGIDLVPGTDALSRGTSHNHVNSAQFHGWYNILKPPTHGSGQ